MGNRRKPDVGKAIHSVAWLAENRYSMVKEAIYQVESRRAEKQKAAQRSDWSGAHVSDGNWKGRVV